MKPPVAISNKAVENHIDMLVSQRDKAWERFYGSLDSNMVAREWRLNLMEGWIRLHDAVEALKGRSQERKIAA